MANLPPQSEPPAPDAPDAFKAELRAMYGRPTPVTASVDEAVRAAAKRAFAEPLAEANAPRRIGVLYRIAGTMAAAAALGLVVILSGVFKAGSELKHVASKGTTPRVAMLGDVNTDGHINIIDAYLLQRSIEKKDVLESQWDLNGDGHVDENDVKAIATASVRLQQASAGVRGLSPRAGEGEQYVQADPPIRFTTYDVIIDSKDAPLAVYQVDIGVTHGDVQITGVEGGGHEAFKLPPYYDPQAMQQNRVIIAAFNTADADKLPRGKVRVATLHVQITGDAEPTFQVKLDAAATVEGKAIEATATLQAKRTQL